MSKTLGLIFMTFVPSIAAGGATVATAKHGQPRPAMAPALQCGSRAARMPQAGAHQG
jgi:hypothetical protein